MYSNRPGYGCHNNHNSPLFQREFAQVLDCIPDNPSQPIVNSLLTSTRVIIILAVIFIRPLPRVPIVLVVFSQLVRQHKPLTFRRGTSHDWCMCCAPDPVTEAYRVLGSAKARQRGRQLTREETQWRAGRKTTTSLVRPRAPRSNLVSLVSRLRASCETD